MKVLHSASDLRAAVHEVFGGRSRRVALVAFVGEGAEAYLPNAKGLELVCCPDGRSTNPNELRRLESKGVKVRFADNLHMKLYWSRLGAVVASANLSDNGLGGGLKELGVLLGPGQVDITHALRIAKPRKVTDVEMRRLDHEYATAPREKRKPVGPPPPRRKQTTFGEWLKQPHRRVWKLGWWDAYEGESATTRKVCRTDYGVDSPDNFIPCKPGDYAQGDWVLCFRTTKRAVREIEWLCVDRQVPVRRSDRGFDRKFSCEAIQAYPLNHYGTSPFDCSAKRFCMAFGSAAAEYGLKRIKDLKSVHLPAKLLNLVVKHYGGGDA